MAEFVANLAILRIVIEIVLFFWVVKSVKEPAGVFLDEIIKFPLFGGNCARFV